eukprot:TRINITY_DN8979_c0_g2_i1.p1 TRINITY_DN8979_c0_g2~~TRINITY_DN8979_c0_g2_i1.p1  ORF type:complete len:2351 (+),score=793.91 TRINITY_DN8979_c0_g2_i1:106-7158(+)
MASTLQMSRREGRSTTPSHESQSAPFGNRSVAANRRQSMGSKALLKMATGLHTATLGSASSDGSQDEEDKAPGQRRSYRDGVLVRGLPDDCSEQELRDLIACVTDCRIASIKFLSSADHSQSLVPHTLFAHLYTLEKVQVLRIATELPDVSSSWLSDSFRKLDATAVQRVEALRQAFARGVARSVPADSFLGDMRNRLLNDGDLRPPGEQINRAFDLLDTDGQLITIQNDGWLNFTFSQLARQTRFDALSQWVGKHIVGEDPDADDRFRYVEEVLHTAGNWRKGAAIVRFTSPSGDGHGWLSFCQPAHQCVTELHGYTFLGQKLQVHWLETYYEARGQARSADPRDALEQETLNKVLTFVWRFRDELLPETIGEEFEVDAWKQAWKQVFLRKTRAQGQDEWLTQFARSFPIDPELDKDKSSDERWYMLAEGEPEEPSRWLGDTTGARDSNLTQCEREFLRESEKIFDRVPDVLDISKDGTISRVELSDFFSAARKSEGADGAFRAVMPNRESKVNLPYYSPAEKVRRDLVVEKERLKHTTSVMKGNLREAQDRACSVHMNDQQLQKFLQCITALQPRKLWVKGVASASPEHGRGGGHHQHGMDKYTRKRLAIAREVGAVGSECGSPSSGGDAPAGDCLSEMSEDSAPDEGEEHDEEEDLRKEVIDLIMKGELSSVEFGLSPRSRASVRFGDRGDGQADVTMQSSRVLDKELVDSAGFIVSDEDKERLMAKAMEHDICPGSHSWEKIFGTMLDEATFKEAYEEATGVDIASEGAGHLWKNLSDKWGGMISKERFLANCRAAPADTLTTGIGGNYYIAFAKAQKESYEMQLNVWLFVVFCVSYFVMALSDRGLGPGYYQGQAIEDQVLQELQFSGQEVWYPWNFQDIEQPSEWWNFMRNVVEIEYPGGGEPGTYNSVEGNMIVGGVLMQQWRVAKTTCDHLTELFSNSLPQACYGPADSTHSTDVDRPYVPPKYPPGTYGRRQNPTDWNEPHYATCNATDCDYRYIPRANYIPDYIQDVLLPGEPPCTISTRPSSYSRTVTIGVPPWGSGRVEVELFKYLIEEQLGVRVELVEGTPSQLLDMIRTGVVDIFPELWSFTRAQQLASVLDSGHAVTAGSLGILGKSGLYLSNSGALRCQGCARWEALRFGVNARLFSCNCAAGPSHAAHVVCTSYTCDHSCSLCAGNDSAGWCGQCPASPVCNVSQPCDKQKGAIWDVHPRHGIATLGPETYRSARFGLNKTMELMYAEDANALLEMVFAASISGEEKSILYFWSEPDAVISATKPVKVQLPPWDPDRCSLPNPIVNDPQLKTTMDCDMPEQQLLKVVRSSLEKTHPDVFRLVLDFHLTTEDLDEMLSELLLQSRGHDDAACRWLQKSEEKWLGWIRRSSSDRAERRKGQFYGECFGPWTGTNDAESFTQHADSLVPMRFNTTSNRKHIHGIHPSGQSSEIPSSERWEQLARESRHEANITAEFIWWKSRPWQFQQCSSLLSMRGKIASTPWEAGTYYGCSGYQAFFPVSWTLFQANEMLTHLQEDGWIDVATRGLMVELITYSQHSNLFFRSRYLAEVSMAGGWVKSAQRVSFRLFRRETGSFVVLGVHAFLTLGFTTYFLLMSISSLMERWAEHVATRRMWYASHGHNLWCPWRYGINKLLTMLLVSSDAGRLIDMSNYALMYAAWFLRFIIVLEGPTTANLLCTDVFPGDLRWIADVTLLLQMLDGTNAILVLLRLLFFMQVIPSMHEIIETVLRAGQNIMYLLVAFLIIMAGFSLSGFIVFGNNIERYNGMLQSFTSLLFVMLGEFDYDKISAQRPDFAFFFFVLFFILIICILFNLIIAVIGNAYGEVVSERVNVEGFVARVQHDPETVGWKPEIVGGLNLGETGIWREIRHFWLLVVLWFSARCPALCANQRSRLRTELMQNPRIFWREYEKVMTDLSGDDIVRVLRAHTKLRLLIQHSHTRTTTTVCAFQPGDHVYVRDGDEDEWRKGVVTRVESGRPRVLPSGWAGSLQQSDMVQHAEQGFFWEDVTHDAVMFVGRGVEEAAVADRRRRRRRSSCVSFCESGSQGPSFSASLPGQVSFAWRSGLSTRPGSENEADWAANLVHLVCDVEVPLGEGGGSIVLKRGSVGYVAREYPVPHSGVVWQQQLIGEVVFANPTAERGPLADKAQTIHFVAQRAQVEPADMVIEEVPEERLELLRVQDFLKSQVGESRCANVGFFLVHLPANVLNVNITTSWVMLLRHFGRWKSAAQNYSRFELTSEDLIQELWSHGPGGLKRSEKKRPTQRDTQGTAPAVPPAPLASDTASDADLLNGTMAPHPAAAPTLPGSQCGTLSNPAPCPTLASSAAGFETPTTECSTE